MAAMIHANRKIVPPDNMTMSVDDVEAFNEIIEEFANVDWTKHNIRIAAILARTITDMITDQEALRDEGSVVYNDKGNAAVNPRRTACQSFASQINQMRRTLALHALATGQKADLTKRRAINKGSQDASPLASDEDEEDQLIAMPKVA